MNLERFVDAQKGAYEAAIGELRSGWKRTHWMWYIFPQIEGLGSSPTARFYAIKSAEEAREYLNHRLLGPRLIECCDALLSIANRSASEIFGYPDDVKLRSSMTLFERAAGKASVFAQVLDKYYDGVRDDRTLDLLPAKGER